MSLDTYPHDLKLIVGYTAREHLLLDLDDTSLPKIVALTVMLLENYPELGHCQIMQSSREKGASFTRINKKGIPRLHLPKPSYHLIFDNDVGYKRCWEIVQTLIDLGLQPRAVRQIRARRRDMTLRVSPSVYSTGIKPAPEPIMQILDIYSNRSDGRIKDYNRFYHKVNDFFNHSH